MTRQQQSSATPWRYPANGEWNDSLRGDFLWSNVNAAEARPDVMTPFTWSLGEAVRRVNQPMPGDHPFVGNIGGRVYVNVTLMLSLMRAVGISQRRALRRMSELLGKLPEGIDIPMHPLPRRAFFSILPALARTFRREQAGARRAAAFLASNPDWCQRMRQRLQAAGTRAELAQVWHAELLPYFLDAAFTVLGCTRPFSTLHGRLRRELIAKVGEADANAMLSNLSGGAELMASLGPVVSLARLARGEITRQAYLAAYGHRGPHEMELSIPYPLEDPAWLDEQLAQHAREPVDAEALLDRRRAEAEAAWQRFAQSYPRQAGAMRKRLDKIGPAARLREAARSEVVRVYALIRAFAVRAGELAGLGDGVFFLSYEEVLSLLEGDDAAAAAIPARRDAYARYCALPAYPAIIRGSFDPFRWAADPHRRSDVFDARSAAASAGTGSSSHDRQGGLLTGHAGAAGIIEGMARVLRSPEEGGQLLAGEVLVAVTTNIGWTPLFPRAAAVVTDVGAPLSHAAIVARELGIPAVVGCVDATQRIQTGDRVRVDGGRGTVNILGRRNA